MTNGAGSLKIELVTPLLTNHGFLSTAPLHHAKRRKYNLCRIWNSMPRLKRSLLATFSLLLTFSFTFYLLGKVYFDEKSLAQEESKRSFYLEALLSDDQSGRNRETIFAKGQFPPPKNDRQRAVVDAFKHAWKGYKRFAWGHDHLKPISGSFDNWFDLGLTIVDSLDTMLIMNLETEFNESREWIQSQLNFDRDITVNLFETTIRVLGGLLSAYYLHGRDRMFLRKATELGYKLAGAFNTPSRIPYSDVNLLSGEPKMPSWTTDSSLSEIGTIQLEFRELSYLTGDPLFERLAFNVSLRLHDMGCQKFDGLCPMFINAKSGEWRSGSSITMGARADSYYEYLLKQWLQTGKRIAWLQTDYLSSVKGIIKHLIRHSEPNKLTFLGEVVNEKTFSPKMDHLACFLPAALALGAHFKLPHYRQHLDYAKKLAFTCYQMYQTKTGLPPEIAHFNLVPNSQTLTNNISIVEGVKGRSSDDMFIKAADAHSLLRPEAAEAWFYLYRVTGDNVYQEWGWRYFSSIEKYAKTEHGYASVRDVRSIPVTHQDKMESFFLAETLKYLYLLFDDDRDVLPLNQFVFNSEAHPFPLRSTT